MSVTSVVNVFQLALDQAGARGNVSSPTEASREAELCRRWYDTVRDSVFRAAFWPSTKKTARLALLAERDPAVDWMTGDPDPHWHFAYSTPSDLISARYLSTYARFDLAWWNGERVAVHTDQDQAILFYTWRNTNPGSWDAALQLAVVFGLAAFVCGPLTGKPRRSRELVEQANNLILDARVAAANEVQESYDSMPEWITARGASGLATRTRFVMPYSPLLTIAVETSPAGIASV